MKVWKISPGRNASVWRECLEGKVTSINWLDDKDLSLFEDKKSVQRELEKRNEGSSGSANSIWKFVHEILPGHLILANDGRSRVVGIGTCQSRYLPPGERMNPRRNAAYHRHCRMVDWFSTFEFDVESNLFVPGTLQDLDDLIQAKVLKSLNKASPKEVKRLKKKIGEELPMSNIEGLREEFKPTKGDYRTIVTRQIAERRGQQRFRNQLISRYEGACLITGCKLLDVLEAAHIKPYRGENDNHVENGLLMRSDIHTLFDLDLIGINPSSHCVELRSELSKHEEYRSLGGNPIKFPNEFRPSKAALKGRYKYFLAQKPT